jgi:hypothetical protein
MAMDSSADLLFKVSMDPEEGIANLQRFRTLISKDLSDLGAEFSGWAKKVFGDMSTMQGALTAGTAAGLASLVALAGGAVALGKELWDLGTKAAQYAEEIEKGTIKTGLSAEQMSGLRYAAKNANLEYDALLGMMVKFQRSVAAAQDPESKEAQAFERLGVSQAQVKAGATELLPLWYATATAMREHADGTMKTATALTLAGRAAAGGIEFFNLGAEGMKRFAAEAERLGLVLNEHDLVAAKSFRQEMIALNAELEGLKLTIGTSVIPAMTGLSVAFEAQMETFKKQAKDGLGGFIKAIFTKDDIKIYEQELAAAWDRLNQRIAAAAGKGTTPVAAPAEVNKATQDFWGLTNVLEQLRQKSASVQGEEAKLAQEFTHLQVEVNKAAAELMKMQAAGTISPEAAKRELAAVMGIPKALADAAADAREKMDEKDAEWAAKHDADMVALALDLDHRLAAQQETSWQRKRVAWVQEINELALHLKDEGQLTEENQAKLRQLMEAGNQKIDRDQKAAYDQGMARLKDFLDRTVEAHATQRDRITLEYRKELLEFNRVEEAKLLKTAQTFDQVLAIELRFHVNRTAVLTKYQQALLALTNSTGWKGVFGNQFAQGIRGNEELLRQWALSANQSLLMVKVAVESLGEMGQRAFGQFAQGMAANIAHAFIYQKSIGQAMRAALAATLETIAAESLVQAIYAMALGFLRLAHHDYPGASAAFTAAAIFGGVGAAAAVAGRFIAPKEAGASGGGSAASGGSGSNAAGGSSSSDTTGAAGGGGPRVAVYIYGHVVGTSGIEQLTDIINEAVVQRDVKLISSGVKTAGVVAR